MAERRNAGFPQLTMASSLPAAPSSSSPAPLPSRLPANPDRGLGVANMAPDCASKAESLLLRKASMASETPGDRREEGTHKTEQMAQEPWVNKGRLVKAGGERGRTRAASLLMWLQRGTQRGGEAGRAPSEGWREGGQVCLVLSPACGLWCHSHSLPGDRVAEA